jgi:hypothetical protein
VLTEIPASTARADRFKSCPTLPAQSFTNKVKEFKSGIFFINHISHPGMNIMGYHLKVNLLS